MAAVIVRVDTAVGVARLERLREAIGPAPLLKAIGLRFQAYVDESFTTRGRGRWPALAPSTLRLRERGGDMPLQDTGLYRASYVVESDQKTSVSIGSSKKTPSGAPLAKIHEVGTAPYTISVRQARVLAARPRIGGWMIFGTKVDHPGIKARPVLPDQSTATKLVLDVVEGALKRIDGVS